MMTHNEPSFLIAANRLHHRGFTTPIIYSREDDVLIGKLEGVAEDISWRAIDLVAFRAAFISEVDAYLNDRSQARISVGRMATRCLI